MPDRCPGVRFARPAEVAIRPPHENAGVRTRAGPSARDLRGRRRARPPGSSRRAVRAKWPSFAYAQAARAGDRVALLHCPLDRDWSTIPHRQHPAEHQPSMDIELLHIPVVAQTLARPGGCALSRVAVDRSVERRSGAAVVSVGVSQDHALDPAQPRSGRGDLRPHRLDAGIEHRHAALILEQVDVHDLGRDAAPDQPDAVGDPLGLRPADLGHHLRAGVGQLGQPCLPP